MAGIKLSGSLPKQTVSTHVVKHINAHKGEKPVSDSRGTLGSAKTHVQTYANGDKEVYVNY